MIADSRCFSFWPTAIEIPSCDLFEDCLWSNDMQFPCSGKPNLFSLLKLEYPDVAYSQGGVMWTSQFQVMLGQLINRVWCHALDSSRTATDESICIDLLDVRKLGEEL